MKNNKDGLFQEWWATLTILVVVVLIGSFALAQRLIEEYQLEKLVKEVVELEEEVTPEQASSVCSWGPPLDIEEEGYWTIVDRQTNYSAFSGDASTVVYSGHVLTEWNGEYKVDTMVYNFPLYGMDRMNEVFYLDAEYGPVNVIAMRTSISDKVGSVYEIEYEDETKRVIMLDVCGGCEEVWTNGEWEFRIDFYTAYLDYDKYDIGYQNGFGMDNANIKMINLREGWGK